MKVGVIGGSGLYELDGLGELQEEVVETPFGSPSDAYMAGKLGEVEVFFLPRHGRGHHIMPSEINHKANICGFKMLGVERVIAVTAVGSLKAEVSPLDVLLPDQYFDRTKSSHEHTFFGNGVVGHVAFGDPVCSEIHDLTAAAIEKVLSSKDGDDKPSFFKGGTYVNMEGPMFSTRSESNFYRSLEFDVIGMTSLGEAKLCREAEICYQTLAMITDYDCWHESEEMVTAEIVGGRLMANTALAKEILGELIPSLEKQRACECVNALKGAILTAKEIIPEQTLKTVNPIMGKYLG
ncbi:S-methyl-5'-thioadenosine phosphorylase [bacterium E08(2017)]|nr:S-methyl-5'-thioadenosine phosphorylase [bacterium E08(2017)]